MGACALSALPVPSARLAEVISVFATDLPAGAAAFFDVAAGLAGAATALVAAGLGATAACFLALADWTVLVFAAVDEFFAVEAGCAPVAFFTGDAGLAQPARA